MTELPSGTLTFLFTDIEGSTRLWEADPDRMRHALARHDELIARTIAHHRGTVFKHTGDGACAVFVAAPDALDAAVAAQQALSVEDWVDVPALRVRMGVHTGQAEPVGDDYFGTALNRCARVMAAGHGGQIVCTATTAAIADGAFKGTLRDLGKHRLRDLGEPQHLFQVIHPDLDEQFPPLRALDVHRHNLPVPRTSFVGRAGELEELRNAFAVSRIVTVTGVGGSGKTRLALQAAAEVVHRYADGVYIAELATTTDPGELAARVAEAVGVPLSSAGSATPVSATELLMRYLVDKEMLVLLDNCEHLLDTCADLVDELLSVAPSVTIAATSREPLGVAGERVLRIPSLGVAGDDASIDGVLSSEAGQLFVDRAAMARPGFTVTPSNVDAVAQICRRLDGIPLAIELAAARLRHLSVQQIAARLDDRFRILTGGGRNALPRHQTLEATLEWSHDLLTDPERVVFRRLSVFVGAFTLDAVEGVSSGDGVDSVDVLDVLGRLVDRSLVVVDDGGPETLYGLLETVRHFAQQKLVAAGEASELRDRHRDWYSTNFDMDMLFDAEYGVVPMDPHVLANARAALEWSLASGDDDAAYRLMAQVAQSWADRALFDEAWEWLERVLARPWSEVVVRERAFVLLAEAFYGSLRNDFAVSLERAEAALALVEAHGLVRLRPQILGSMGISTSVLRSVAEGEQLMEEAAQTAADLGLPTLAATSWVQLAGFRVGHDPAGARAAAESALALPYRVEPRGRSLLFGTLAFARLLCGDTPGALAAVEDLDRGNPDLESWAELEGALARAVVVAASGRDADARESVERALATLRRLRVPLAETACLVTFGAIEAFGGDPERALVLLGAARRRFDEERAWRAPIVGALYVQSNAAARAKVADDVAARAREEGLSLSAEEAFALVS